MEEVERFARWRVASITEGPHRGLIVWVFRTLRDPKIDILWAECDNFCGVSRERFLVPVARLEWWLHLEVARANINKMHITEFSKEPL